MKTKMAVTYGTEGPDTKNGTKENDTLYGWARGGNASSPSGNDTLNGNAGKDQLYGGTGNDNLDGGLGHDTLNGGTGNDTYIIDVTFDSEGFPVTDSIDSIVEATSSGTDTVQLIQSNDSSFYQSFYSLDSNVENLTLKSGQEYYLSIIVQGNALDNVLIGGDISNFFEIPKNTDYNYGLQGGGGNDKIYGEAGSDGLAGDSGNDTLIGGKDDDRLDGGLGFDSLIGGTDDDIYFIDNASDTITEYFNQGNDWVVSSLKNNTLGEKSHLENLQLSGSALSGTGNSLDNNIYGNSNNNYLYGADGNDVLDDFNSAYEDYYDLYGEVEPSNDYLDGGAGNDTLNAAGGNDSLYGGTGNDSLFGSSGNDFLNGGAGDDTLDGGSFEDEESSVDTLTGGTGADNFAFTRPSDGIDTITDFSVVDDTIRVDAYEDEDYFDGGLTVNATITLEQFVIGSIAGDKSDRFIYNQKTGALFYDSDGTGEIEQVQFAQLSTGLAMTNADIFVIDPFT